VRCLSAVLRDSHCVACANLHNSLEFNGTDGYGPQTSLVQGPSGNFRGTTWEGGAYGYGTVFKITPDGMLSTLYSFCSEANCADGAISEAPMVLGANASDGNYYGTTEGGGETGVGTVFKITPDRVLTTLYSFCSQTNCTDGEAPYGGLVQANSGTFYGTASEGGAYGYGTVFKITPDGVLTTLYSFCSQANCADGSYPDASLVRGTDGNYYGITLGTVFKITPAGKLTTLHTFTDTYPLGLVQASSGNFYGTTHSGGAYGKGTVFEITPDGVLTTLYSFCAQTNCPDGSAPSAGVVQGTDGNFYGTTQWGGSSSNCSSGCGTLFEITPEGTLSTLHSFDNTDGYIPVGLIQGTDGDFYGTTAGGGAGACVFGGCGTVFRLSVGLGPFVETLPTHGHVGRFVRILGNALTGATSVTFNGTPATWKLDSDTQITTTVPSGATTGNVQVVTPSGTLSSNVAFQVLP